MKFLIALQFFHGDKATAMRLARLIADIEGARREDVELIFVARFDTDHDRETIDYVARKFPVHWITTHTRWTGWPAGPNAMAKDTLDWIATNRKDALGVLMLEPDCVPAKVNWLDVLIDEWRMAKAAGAWMMGAWRNSGGEWGHVNGNAILTPTAAMEISSVIDQHMAWDAAIAPWMRHHWFVTERIHNCFQSVDAKSDELFPFGLGHNPRALIHGYKDTSLMEMLWGSEGLVGQPNERWYGKSIMEMSAEELAACVVKPKEL